MDAWLLNFTTIEGWGMPVFILLTTLIAGVLSSILGLEREFRGQSAGLRTHVLLSVGSSLMMSISIYAIMASGNQFDASRIGAGVVSGIGFLCAGCIIKTGANIKGLTTSATLWICGGLGLACGAGFVVEAIVATAVSFLFLQGLVFIERLMDKKAPTVEITCSIDLPILTLVHHKADELNMTIKDIYSEAQTDEQNGKSIFLVIIFAYKSSDFAVQEFIENFSSNELVYSVSGSKFKGGRR